MDANPRDRREVESVDPDERLQERRRERDEEDYRFWCESTYRMVQLGDESLHPADILDQLATDAARRGRAEASDQVRSELEQTVCDLFPAPIAVPFTGPVSSISNASETMPGTWSAWLTRHSRLHPHLSMKPFWRDLTTSWHRPQKVHDGQS